MSKDNNKNGAVHVWSNGCVECCIDVLRTCECIQMSKDNKQYGAVHVWLNGCVECCIVVLRTCDCIQVYNDTRQYGAVHVWLNVCVECCIDVLRTCYCIQIYKDHKTKIEVETYRVLLIAPFWPRQAWFQRLIRLLIHPPDLLPRRADLIAQPRSKIYHPGSENLHLTCWMLSNIPSDQQAFHQTLHPWLPEAAESSLEGPTTAGFNITINGAGTTLLIPALVIF